MVSLGDKTRFEFPFNNPAKSTETAFSEVKAGLEQLSEITLLFLNNLRSIKWRIGEQEGEVLRDEHSASHVEVLKLAGGNISSSHWLRFAAPVQNVDKFTAPMEGVERQKVAVAFELAFVGDTALFDGKKPLAKQLKIVPALRGKVAVFFPAEKETSGLRFHVHAPFIPELSRASIKSSPENLPLFEQLAVVAASSLHEIKSLGLLTGQFLSVLPNDDDPLPERYALIREAVLDEMLTEPLVPTHGGGFAPGERLCQAPASIKSLLSSEDLAFVTGRKDQPDWAIGATQKNQSQEKFLDSLDMGTWDVEALKDFLESRYWLETPIDPVAEQWLADKSLEWHQMLYAVLNKHCEDEEDFFALDETKIVRMADGTYSVPRDAYFQTGTTHAKDPLPRVEEKVFEVGTKKAQQAGARKFLENIGVKVPGELEEVTFLLNSRYGPEGEPPSDKVYLADLKRLIAFADKNPQCSEMMAEAFLFRVDSPKFNWCQAANAYIDTPIASTGLRTFYDSIEDNEDRRWPLSTWYKEQSIPLDKLAKFAGFAGVESEFLSLFGELECERNEAYSYLKQVPGERYSQSTGINSDFALTVRACRMLIRYTIGGSQLVWSAMCSRRASNVLRATYQKNMSNGVRYADSQLICLLRRLSWIPQTDGSFVMPSEATASKMPKGFAVDTGFEWLKAVGFGSEEKKRETESASRIEQRKQLGFDSEDQLQDALALVTLLPANELKRLVADARKDKSDLVELPERQVRNADLRSQRVGEQAKATSGKSSVIKPRSVQLGVEAARQEAKLYLTDQYTNTNGQMICQACKGELPFKLPNGSYYFEAVEIIRSAPKRFREGFLALCPNHAAAYQHANAQYNSMYAVIANATGNVVEIALGGIETTIYFTETHLADAKASLGSIEDDDA